MSFLERLIQTILSIPLPIVGKTLYFLTEVFSHPIINTGIFVDIIPQMNYQIKILGRHMRIPVKVPGFVVLTGSKGESHAIGHYVPCRCGFCTANRTSLIARMKSKEIPSIRLQSLHLNMDGMPQLGYCHRRTLCRN